VAVAHEGDGWVVANAEHEARENRELPAEPGLPADRDELRRLQDGRHPAGDGGGGHDVRPGEEHPSIG
jgi:hypothetical protein